mmetsp:Transcript_43712/g.70967  ORF Transcript_43712/g.70967 Transcript_43712/m.70967 type:complete len:80 (-) Transcript_43712:14-253(-)
MRSLRGTQNFWGPEIVGNAAVQAPTIVNIHELNQKVRLAVSSVCATGEIQQGAGQVVPMKNSSTHAKKLNKLGNPECQD